ncbi:MAG: hypothetical protein AAF716_13700 [Cyanobacteria bacterium P01_D01_bin.1]
MAAKSTTNRLTPKKILYHPLTWLALGAHIVLLVVPFNPSEPKAVEESAEQPEDTESIPVDILNLVEIATSEPPPEPAAPPPASVPTPAITPPTQPIPVPAETAPPDVDSAPDVQPETAPPDESQLQQQAVEQPVAYDPSADQQAYIRNLDSLGLAGYKDPITGENSLPAAREFRKGTDSSYFITETSVDGIPTVQAVAGARDARRLDGEPGAILSQQEETYAALGLSFDEVGDYGGEPLHQLTKEDGSPVMYLSLVRLQGSTLLVIWQSDPRN